MMLSVSSLKNNQALINTLIVTVGSLLGSFFSYLLQFGLGRVLSVEDFGSFNVLLSFSYLLGVPAGVFGLSLVKLVSSLLAKEDFKTLTTLFWKLVWLSLLIGGIIFIVIFLARDVISRGLRIGDVMAVVMFGAVMGFSFFNVIQQSYFQGLMRFKALSIYRVLSSVFRLVLPFLFAYLGYRVAGVFFGMSIGILLTFILSLFGLRKNFTEYENADVRQHVGFILSFGASVLFINFGLMLLNNVDMILVKSFFDPTLAGYYAGTVTLGKILLFGAGSVATVMFPVISNLVGKGESYKRQFRLFFIIQVIFSIGGMLSFWFLPSIVTHVFFGSKFDSSIEYLPLFSIFIGLYVILNFLILYFLAINKNRVFFVLVPGVILQLILINKFHGTLYEVIWVNIGVTLLSLILCLLFFLRVDKSYR